MEEIAHQIGHRTVYSFSAAFRRWSGIPPARFKRG
jgi:AraC-like DNA-binding protein